MATSGVRDSSNIATSIITQALRKIQIGVGGETLADEYASAGVDALNTLIRTWAVDGVRLWLNETQTVTLVAGTSQYTLSPRTLEVFQAYRRSDGTDDIPVRIFTREEYSRLPNKTTTGAPYAVWIDRRIGTSVATVYPVPTSAEVASSMTLRLDVKRQIEDVTATTEEIEFPPEWLKALIYNLAVELAPEFNKQPSELVIMQAMESYNLLRGNDREGSVYIRRAPQWR